MLATRMEISSSDSRSTVASWVELVGIEPRGHYREQAGDLLVCSSRGICGSAVAWRISSAVGRHGPSGVVHGCSLSRQHGGGESARGPACCGVPPARPTPNDEPSTATRSNASSCPISSAAPLRSSTTPRVRHPEAGVGPPRVRDVALTVVLWFVQFSSMSTSVPSGTWINFVSAADGIRMQPSLERVPKTAAVGQV